MTAKSDLRNIPLSQIRTNPVALREVNKDDEDYQKLRTDIGRRGIMMALTVTEKKDVDGTPFFQLVDGLHRYSSACDVGLETVPVNVLELSDMEIIESQIAANLMKVDTKPVQYTKALQRMLAMDPSMTLSSLAERVSESTSWVSQRFNLLKLDDSIQKLVDDGEIKLTNALALSKMPKAEQHEWTDQAMTQVPDEFVPAVNARVKELKEAAREGRPANSTSFVPTPRLRKLSELKSEHENPQIGPALTAKLGLDTAAEGFAAGIAYCLNMDKMSLESAKAKWEADRKKQQEDKKRRDAVRAEQRLRDAQAKAEKARQESALTPEEIEAELKKNSETVEIV